MRHRVGFWFSYCAARAVDSHRCPPKAPKENPGAGRGFVRRAIRWISRYRVGYRRIAPEGYTSRADSRPHPRLFHSLCSRAQLPLYPRGRGQWKSRAHCAAFSFQRSLSSGLSPLSASIRSAITRHCLPNAIAENKPDDHAYQVEFH